MQNLGYVLCGSLVRASIATIYIIAVIAYLFAFQSFNSMYEFAKRFNDETPWIPVLQVWFIGQYISVIFDYSRYKFAVFTLTIISLCLNIVLFCVDAVVVAACDLIHSMASPAAAPGPLVVPGLALWLFDFRVRCRASLSCRTQNIPWSAEIYIYIIFFKNISFFHF